MDDHPAGRPLLDASRRLPTWVRATSILILPVVAFATNASLGTPALGPLFAVFVGLSAFALFAHLPVMQFDGPLPFSDLGIHAHGDIVAWSEVARVEALGERDLVAVLTDDRMIRLRVRGARTRGELAAALARHKPEAVAF